MSDTPMEKRFADLDNVTAIAVTPGNANANEYMRGMANGLILAQAIMKDHEPQYIEAETIPSPLREAASRAGNVSDAE